MKYEIGKKYKINVISNDDWDDVILIITKIRGKYISFDFIANPNYCESKEFCLNSWVDEHLIEYKEKYQSYELW